MKDPPKIIRKDRIANLYYPVFEFHIARSIRNEYQIDDSFFSTNGKIIFANFHAAREFVYKFNMRRHPDRKFFAGDMKALGVMEELFHLVIREYEKQNNTNLFANADKHLQTVIGRDKLNLIFYDFIDKFPPSAIYCGQISIAKYLKGSTHDRLNRHIILEEFILLYLANINPAAGAVKDLFDMAYLDNQGEFSLLIDKLQDFVKKQPTFGIENQDLITFLKSPASIAPQNLFAQLEYIYRHWRGILPQNAVSMLLKSQDFLKEDKRINYIHDFTKALSKKGLKKKGVEVKLPLIISEEPPAITKETDYEQLVSALTPIPESPWMGEVVLLSKNINVWLSQLSLNYAAEIRHLDQIPDKEFEKLKKWNINALWLIGIWERSEASRQLKHLTGHMDADASAYSLHEYEIAQSLGGNAAYNDLNRRAALYGIRLACDFIPNHTGIDSKWIIENPEYFIQSSYSPFPSYRFTGQNLYSRSDMEIRVEDGYFTGTDAAVVFQIINRQSNTIRYIYHGNDGTLVPWNDTAQLDILQHGVRQAVIQKILDVAGKFTIIRFDAAMTIARQQFARLWYPAPGKGGAIASRVDHSLTMEQFNALFPVDFWNELVDRISAERPDTLLLGEVFWHMENDFIRNQRLHRVYNSAFMQMLRSGENKKFRSFLADTLKENPENLHRYINYMSNPDEESARKQFGSEDKYFGVCVLMCCLPGLPMFAHGQIEGYAEKYGMEYKHPLYEELPDKSLIERHEKEIFPLLKNRYLFARSDNFNLYNLADSNGKVNENVFVFTNNFKKEKVLIVFNNHPDKAEGYVHFSEPKRKNSTGERQFITISVAQALDIDEKGAKYFAATDHISGLEYLLANSQGGNSGIYFCLRGYEHRVLWNFRDLDNSDGRPEILYQKIGCSGVESIETELEKCSDL